jgi:hypothetical protein
MKRVLVLLLVCALVMISVTGRPFPVTRAAGEALYVEIPQDSYCRAPATTVYLPIMMGNLSADPSLLIRSIEVLDGKGQTVAVERTEFKLESLAGKACSSEEIRAALGIIPPAAADITTARALITQATGTADSKQRTLLVDQAFLASRAKQSMKNPEELTAEEARIQHLLRTTTLAVDVTQFSTDTTSETAVPVTVRITGEQAGQAFTVDQQTTVYPLASLPDGGTWHPGDGHVHTAGLPQPDNTSQYAVGYEESYGYSDAQDGASVLGRRDQANSRGMQWIVMTDHAGADDHFAGLNPVHLPQNQEPRLETDEWSIYQAACSLATTQYSPTVTVCPGEELATKEIQGSADPGHLLCYGKSSYASSFESCSNLTYTTTGNGGFGIVAHPYRSISWSNWSATPWSGLEVISNESNLDTNAVNKWDQQLLNKLSDEIAGNYWCVAMANSDVHTQTSPMWGSNMNYIYTGSYSVPGTSPAVVWNAIRNGALTASSDGSFAAATVNGLYPGSHTTVLRNSTVSVFVTGTTAFPTDEYARVRVLRNGVEVSSQQFHTAGLNFNRTVSVQIPSNCYIRVEVDYGTRPDDNQEPNWYGYCMINPVFIGTSN